MIQVVHEDADDFTKAQRHDGEVVTAQAQGGCAQQDTKKARQRSGGWHHNPQRRVHALRKHGSEQLESFGQMGRRQQAVHVGADGKKRHIAQIEQTSVTHHNIEPERQQHIEQCHVGNPDPGIAKALQQQRQDQQSGCGQKKNNDFLLLFHKHPFLSCQAQHRLTHDPPPARRADPKAAASTQQSKQ